MDFTQQDLYSIVNRDHMLGDITVEEQAGFISEQIKAPFDSGRHNYFRKLKKLAVSKDELDVLCADLFKQIEDVYPGLEFNLDDYDDRHIAQAFEACYKFFVRGINKLMYLFLREYLFNNKNRKGIVEDFMSSKVTSYPKEQYGKKEYYILITKLSQIVNSIGEDNIRLSKFINYIDRAEEAPLYLDDVKDLLERGVIVDHNIVEDIFRLFSESDARPGILNKLEMVITKSLIIPCLKESGLLDISIRQNIAPDDDDDDADEEEDQDYQQDETF